MRRLDDDLLVRIACATLAGPRSFVTSPSTQQLVLCDNAPAPGPDASCTKVILQAMVDAMAHLESPQGFGPADTTAWRITMKRALPGGVIHDRRSPHHRDLLDRSCLSVQPFDASYAISEIVAAGGSRWVFH